MITRPRAVAFIATYSVVYVAVGLYPFDFDFGRPLRFYPIGPWDDVIWNVVAFIPFGAAFAAAHARRAVWRALGYCTVLALCVESLQTFVPERFTQVSDVVCNGMGAWLGAWLASRFVCQRRR